MFPNDIVAGMLMVVSAILSVVALIGYIRYRMKGMILSFVAFLIFLIESVLYTLNIFIKLKLDMLFWVLLLNLIILFVLYFSISLKR